MLRRNKEDREVDRVLVVADLENGWESIIGWAISRSQHGDSIFILNVISTVKHAERINRDAGGDSKEASESADEEERLLRGRLKLLSDTLKTLSKSVAGVKVMASMQVVPRTKMGSAVLHQVESMALTRVVINAGGYLLNKGRGTTRHWAVLIEFLEKRLSCDCLIAIVDNNRLAEVKRGLVVPSSSEEDSEVPSSDMPASEAERVASLRARWQLAERRAMQALEDRDSDTKGSGDDTETPRASAVMRPKTAKVRAGAASVDPLRRHSSDGTNHRRVQLPEYEGETLYSTAEESMARSKSPALRPLHMHGHDMTDKIAISSRPSISKRGSSSPTIGGRTRGAHSGVLGLKFTGTPPIKEDSAGNGARFGLADFLFGTPKRSQAKRAAGSRPSTAGAAVGGPVHGEEEEAKAVDAGFDKHWEDEALAGMVQPSCFNGTTPGRAVPRQMSRNPGIDNIASAEVVGLARAGSIGAREARAEARDWLGHSRKAGEAEEEGIWLPWSKVEERKKHSDPERSAKPAKLEDTATKITWLSFLGVAPLRPSKQKGEDRVSPRSSELKPAIVKLEERVGAVLERKGALQVSEEVSVMGWPLKYVDAKERKVKPRPRPLAKSGPLPRPQRVLEPVAEARENVRGPAPVRRASQGKKQKGWSGFIPKKIKSYMRVKKNRGSRANDVGKQQKPATARAEQDENSEEDEDDGWAPVGITYSAAVRKIDHINNWLMDIPTDNGSDNGGARSEIGMDLKEEAPADWSLRRGFGAPEPSRPPGPATQETGTIPIRGYSSSFADRQRRLPVIRTSSKGPPESPVLRGSAKADPKSRSGILEGRPSTGDAGFRRHGSASSYLRPGSLQGSPHLRPSTPPESRGSFLSASKTPRENGAQQHQPRPWSPSPRGSRRYTLGSMIQHAREGSLNGTPRSMRSKGDGLPAAAADWTQPPSQQLNFRPWSKGGQRGRPLVTGRLAALAQQQEALGWGSGIGSFVQAKEQSPDMRPRSFSMRGPQYSGEIRRGRD